MKKQTFLKSSLLTLPILLMTLISFNMPLLADEDDQEKKNQKIEQEKIAFLLDKVEKSEATFIRNGDEHPAKKARKHLEHKMNMARKMFWFFGPSRPISARDFIDKIAAESSTTGKPYHIRTKDGKTYTTKEWLDSRLKEFQQSSQSP